MVGKPYQTIVSHAKQAIAPLITLTKHSGYAIMHSIMAEARPTSPNRKKQPIRLSRSFYRGAAVGLLSIGAAGGVTATHVAESIAREYQEPACVVDIQSKLPTESQVDDAAGNHGSVHVYTEKNGRIVEQLNPHFNQIGDHVVMEHVKAETCLQLGGVVAASMDQATNGLQVHYAGQSKAPADPR